MTTKSMLPRLPHILSDVEQSKYLFLARLKEIRQQLESKELFPDYFALVNTALVSKRVVEKEQHIRLVHSSPAGLQQIDELVKLYHPSNLSLIDSEERLDTLLLFTRWLNKECVELVKIGRSILNLVRRSLAISVRGLGLHLSGGILYLRYKNEDGGMSSRLYGYTHLTKKAGKGSDEIHTLPLIQNVEIQKARAETLPTTNKVLIKNNQSSFISMSCSIAVPFKKTLLRVVEYELMARLINSRSNK